MMVHVVSMETCVNFSGSAHRNEGSTRNLSSKRDHGDGAKGMARAQKKRKVRTSWSDASKTQQLLTAYRKRMDENGQSFMRRDDWQTISESVDGMAGEECQGRMDTLTKSFNKIKKYCAEHHKQFSELGEEDFGSLKLATKMEEIWYCQMCEIKEQSQNAMVVQAQIQGTRPNLTSPASSAVMVCFLSMAGFFFFPLSVWSVFRSCRHAKSEMGAEDGINGC